MLPTLAERLREQRAKGRSRHPSRAPWPMPSEPPTALLFQVRPGPAVPEPPVVLEFEPPAQLEPEPPAPAPARAQDPAPAARTALAEVLALLVLAVVVLIDGALALASLVDQITRRQRVRPVASPAVSSASLPVRSGPWAVAAHP